MTGNELTAIVRDYIKDEAQPYLWSDAAILRHLQKAERELCEKTHVLIDTAVTFNTVAGTNTYTMASNVQRVYAMRVAANSYPLSRLRSVAYGIHYQDAAEDEPTLFSTSIGPKIVTLYPSPDAVYGMEAICAITPDTPLAARTESSLEEEYQLELANYAAFKCLVTNDVDGERTGTAEEYKLIWEEFVRDLKRDIYRYRTDDKLVLQNWTGKRIGGAANVQVGS